jgi:hypothetical protein
VLYLHDSHSNASPKAISGRTSYLRVRLEFHRYPQLIPALFNVRGFGPPVSITSPSSWPGVDHSVSGLRPQTLALPRPTKVQALSRGPGLLRRAFAAATAFHLNLACDRNSPVHSTKGTPSRVNALRLIVGTRFQVLFHSPPGVLFTFPSRYWFTIGRQGVFSLRRWSSLIPTGFLVSRGTWGFVSEFSFVSDTGLSPSLVDRSKSLLLRREFVTPCETPLNPACASTHGLGCSAFARRY